VDAESCTANYTRQEKRMVTFLVIAAEVAKQNMTVTAPSSECTRQVICSSSLLPFSFDERVQALSSSTYPIETHSTFNLV